MPQRLGENAIDGGHLASGFRELGGVNNDDSVEVEEREGDGGSFFSRTTDSFLFGSLGGFRTSLLFTGGSSIFSGSFLFGP